MQAELEGAQPTALPSSVPGLGAWPMAAGKWDSVQLNRVPLKGVSKGVLKGVLKGVSNSIVLPTAAHGQPCMGVLRGIANSVKSGRGRRK